MKSELYRVVFGDDHEEKIEADGTLDAAKKAKRAYKRKTGKEVRVLRVKRA